MQRLGTVAKPLLLEFRNAWSRQIRALYSLQFMTKCPKSLHCLQSLSFLPHVLQIPAPWPILDIQTVANKCGISSECFSQSRQSLAQALANSSEFSLLCAEVLKYRLEKKQDCCTALRHLTSLGMYQVGERCNGLTPRHKPSSAGLGMALSASKKPDGRQVLLPIFSKLIQALILRTPHRSLPTMEACREG